MVDDHRLIDDLLDLRDVMACDPDVGEICQFDVWQPRDEVPVGHSHTRQGWVVIACRGYSRAGAGLLVFSKENEDLLAGIARLPGSRSAA